MCNAETTRICENLQAIAIDCATDPTFGEWMTQVQLALRNKSAISTRSNRILHGCFKDGLTPGFVAERIDKLFEAMQPRLFIK